MLTVLPCLCPLQSPELTLSQKIKAKIQNPDLLELCHSVPKEVVALGGKGYGQELGEDDFAPFRAWLRCYGVSGMSFLRDRHRRTIWFQGDPGPLAPKGGKSRKKKNKEAQRSLEDTVEGPLSPPPPNGTSKKPARPRKSRRSYPEQNAVQQPAEVSPQHAPEVPPGPKKGKKRRGPPSAPASKAVSAGKRKSRKFKADTPASAS